MTGSLFGALASEIEWMANRSAGKWLDGFLSISYPVEIARVSNRENKLFGTLNDLGIKVPNYGDGRWRRFWVKLVFISERRDLSKARRLLDDLGPPNEK